VGTPSDPSADLGAPRSCTAITTGSDHGLTFRAVRFDCASAGTVTVVFVDATGTRRTGITQNVQPGEVWSMTGKVMPQITSVSAGVTAWALG